MTASDVIAPDVIASDRGAITSGRRIQVSVRETHGPQRPMARKPTRARALFIRVIRAA